MAWSVKRSDFAGRMDGEHKHHRNVLEAFEHDLVACPDLQSVSLPVCVYCGRQSPLCPFLFPDLLRYAAEMKGIRGQSISTCGLRSVPVLYCSPERMR